MNIFAYFTVLQRIQYLYCMYNTDSVRWDAFFRFVVIVLTKFGLSYIAINLLNSHVSKSVKLGPTNKYSRKQDGIVNAS
jgi:hypothetical protein